MTTFKHLWELAGGFIIFSLFAGFGFFTLYATDSLPASLQKIPELITGVRNPTQQHSLPKKTNFFGPVQLFGWAFVAIGTFVLFITIRNLFVPGAAPATPPPSSLNENHPIGALIFCVVLWAIGIFLMFYASHEKEWSKGSIQVPGTVVRSLEKTELEKVSDEDGGRTDLHATDATGEMHGYRKVTYYISVIAFSFEDQEREITLPVQKTWKDPIGKQYMVGINPSNPKEAHVIDSSVAIFPIFAGFMCIMFGLMIAHVVFTDIFKSAFYEPYETTPALEETANPEPKTSAPAEIEPPNFLTAVMSGNTRQVERFIEQGADVNQRGTGGYTPLMFSAIYGDVDIAKLLLKAKADINAVVQTPNGPLTALQIAIANDKMEVAKLLKSAGAKE